MENEKRIPRIFISLWIAAPALTGLGILILFILGIRMEERYAALEEKIQNTAEAQTEIMIREGAVLREELAASTELLERTIASGTGSMLQRIDRADRHVGTVERIYADILTEQKKKTLESLYEEEALLARMRSAEELFKAAKYRQAHDLYTAISEAQPENSEARFYRCYTLFLLNKNDRDQYRFIREGFLQLERTGYSRPEIRETLSYMAAEEA